MKDYYVLLTGSKNNAGDFLIKHRAISLLRRVRPDRDIVDIDRWKPFTPEDLEKVNSSRALILAGGPGLRKEMRPELFPMTKSLDDIRVPIIMMGIGWKSIQGDWQNTMKYPLSGATVELLERIDDSGYTSGVRDYHTLNVLMNRGFRNVLMTGCPALYSAEHLHRGFDHPNEINNISFSMGVSFVQSRSMKQCMLETISALKDYFPGKNFKIVFHHSIDRETFLQVYRSDKRFIDEHNRFFKWLEKNAIEYTDISGSAEKLMEHYTLTDLHIGFRVHAHIFMSSISRPSFLISEDGRGKAVRYVLSGLVLDGYNKYYDNLMLKAIRRGGIYIDSYRADGSLAGEVINNIDYEIKNNYPRISLTRASIDSHYSVMERFLMQLP